MADRRPLIEHEIQDAILSKHDFILLGLRGQAKTRLLRALPALLDAAVPAVEGCEINCDPMRPICAPCHIVPSMM